jgi:hypothetical protein
VRDLCTWIISWTGDEEDGRLTDEARLILDLGRLVKVNHGAMEGMVAAMMRQSWGSYNLWDE